MSVLIIFYRYKARMIVPTLDKFIIGYHQCITTITLKSHLPEASSVVHILHVCISEIQLTMYLLLPGLREPRRTQEVQSGLMIGYLDQSLSSRRCDSGMFTLRNLFPRPTQPRRSLSKDNGHAWLHGAIVTYGFG